jgi:hypothetical protein
MANNVPVTALSSNVYQSVAQLVVGTNYITPPTVTAPGFWYVVVDLSNNLNVVANEYSSSNNAPPADIAAMLGNPNYFLFFIGMAPITGMMPQGDLATFLLAAGAGAQLASLEQTIGQLGTGFLSSFSYVLGATLNAQDLPGFEESSLWNPSVLTMQFMPLTVSGQTVYAPVQMGTELGSTMMRASQSPPLPA